MSDDLTGAEWFAAQAAKAAEEGRRRIEEMRDAHLIEQAMAEVRAGNAVLYEVEFERRYVWITEKPMTNAKANSYSRLARRLADATRTDRAEAEELEAEEREAQERRDNMERWET